MALSQSERDELEFQLGQYFKPTMPINREDLFSGRRGITREVLDAVNQQGQHIILYGERGVGKTSLANMIMIRAKCPTAHIMAPHINCTGASSYNSIWIALLEDVIYRAERQKIDLPQSIMKLNHDFENGLRVQFSSTNGCRVVSELSDGNMIVVLIIDEIPHRFRSGDPPSNSRDNQILSIEMFPVRSWS